ncbi:MAG: hypothetical protein LiPW16_394, partial [Microgenomates group bacterium LiPW_16]
KNGRFLELARVKKQQILPRVKTLGDYLLKAKTKLKKEP